MSKKDRGMPELVFIGPPKRRGRYKHSLFEVLSRGEGNVPIMCRLIREDEVVDVTKVKEFMTAYLPEEMTQPHDINTDK